MKKQKLILSPPRIWRPGWLPSHPPFPIASGGPGFEHVLRVVYSTALSRRGRLRGIRLMTYGPGRLSTVANFGTVRLGSMTHRRVQDEWKRVPETSREFISFGFFYFFTPTQYNGRGSFECRANNNDNNKKKTL